MDKSKRKRKGDDQTIYDEIKQTKMSAHMVLQKVKTEEKEKLKTHYWHISPDGKTRTLKRK